MQGPMLGGWGLSLSPATWELCHLGLSKLRFLCKTWLEMSTGRRVQGNDGHERASQLDELVSHWCS